MDHFALPTFDLSLAAAGLRAPGGGPLDIRWVLEFARISGYHAVQVNAADPLTRPRDLSRSARRDLAAHIRRHELVCSGVDLWIPKQHFTDEAHIDRAVNALLGAADFATDLAELTGGTCLLSVSIPWEGADSVLSTLAERASRLGLVIANHAYPWPESLAPESPVLVGIDPPAVILDRGDAAEAVSRASSSGVLRSVRLGDLSAAGRVAPGDGSLDTLAYRVAIATASYDGYVLVDARGLPATEDSGGQQAIARRLAEEFGRPRTDT